MLWHASRQSEKKDAQEDQRTRIVSAVPLYPFRVIAGLALVGYIVFLVIGIRVISAHKQALEARNISDAREQLEAWQKISGKNPWNSMYKLVRASKEVGLLGTPISIDAQRQAIESVTKILREETRNSSDPLVYWFAAQIYSELQTYAEGSSQLARDHYQNARALWPKNVFLPVSIAQFYRSNIDSLISTEVSAADLRQQARIGLEQALSVEPEYLPARLELAFLIEDDAGIASALAELEPWEEASPEITYHIGRLYFNDANFEQAVEKFKETLEAVPSHSNALYSLGVSYFRLEKYEQALEQFNEVSRLNPGNSDVQEKISQTQEKLGE